MVLQQSEPAGNVVVYGLGGAQGTDTFAMTWMGVDGVSIGMVGWGAASKVYHECL